KLVSTLPKESSADTVRPKPTPAVTLAGGSVVTTSFMAGAAVTAIDVVVAWGRLPLVALSVSPGAAVSSKRPVKAAAPERTGRRPGPPSGAPAEPLARARAMLPW